MGHFFLPGTDSYELNERKRLTPTDPVVNTGVYIASARHVLWQRI